MGFSTEETITAKIKTAKLKLWGDRNRDGVLDPDTLTQAIDSAQAQILAALYARYGTQVEDWTIGTVPDILKSISDSLTIFYIASGSNAINESVKLSYDNAMLNLTKLSVLNDKSFVFDLSLPGISDSSDNDTTTAQFESVFDAIDDIESAVTDTLENQNDD